MKKIVILVLIISVTFFVAYSLDIYISLNSNFLISELDYFFLFFTVVFFLLLSIAFKYYKNKIIYILISYIGFVLAYFYVDDIKDYNLKITMKNANKIILLLDEYKKEFGFYPNKLAELDGKYDIPKSTLGIFPRDFIYMKDKKSYILKIYSYNQEIIFYESERKKWNIND